MWSLSLAIWLLSSYAYAHPLSPVVVVLEEREPGRFGVRFRRSETAAFVLSLDLPAACVRGEASEGQVGDQREERFELVCPGGLAGKTLRVLGLSELSLSALVYVEFHNGQRARGLLNTEQPSWVLPRETRAAEVFGEYLLLGIQHLLTGPDHLLFLLGLLFLASGVRGLVWTLTAFTLGHSVTLCLAALELVSLQQGPVEVGIALSLTFMALSLLAPERDRARLSARLPWLSFALGLLHGLGFAGALAEAGLPTHQIPLSLLGFNLGVECAQLGLVLPLALLARSVPRLTSMPLQRGAAYAIGALSAFWCIERALVWFG